MNERLARPVRPAAPLPPLDLPLNMLEETPFLRPPTRTRMRRSRRSWLFRATLLLQVGGALLVGAGGLWAGYSKLMSSHALQVARVDVRGSRFLSEGEVRALLGPAVGENILGIDIESLKAHLRASPWVADATVRRSLPDTIQVEIRERLPVALAEVERLHLMDGEGMLIEVYGPRTAGFDLPIVRGLDGLDAETRGERAQRAGAMLADLQELGAEVSEVQVEDTGEIRVVLRGAGEVLRFGAPPYKSRLLTFLALRRELAERCPGAESFDLRFKDRIYARRPEPEAKADAAARPRAADLQGR
jgi:cell division protein FtsQ